MRLNALKRLIEINILYSAQGSSLSNLRKKQSKNKTKRLNVGLRIISSYFFLCIVYLVLFGIQAFFTPLKEHPGMFSNMIGIFYIFMFSQGFLSVYNVFYESKDLQSYRPYAFTESEIMLSKGIAVLLPILMGVFPIICYVLALNLQSGQSIFLAFPIFLITIALIFLSLAFLLVTSVHFLTKTSIFRRYKKLASNIIISIGFIAALGSIMLVNGINASVVDRTLESGRMVDQISYFYPMMFLHSLAVSPFSVKSILGLLAWSIIVILLFFIIKKKVLPEFYETAVVTSEITDVTVRKTRISVKGQKSFKQFVWFYNLGMISQGSTFVQTVLLSAIMPYIILSGVFIGMMKSGGLNKLLSLQFLLPSLLLILLIATFNSGGTNLTSVGISLERENFDYLKSLPFDFTTYLQLKFWVLFTIQSILPIILLEIISIYLGAPLSILLIFFVYWLVVSLAWSAWGYYRDYQYLVTNWSSVTELMNRSNKLVQGLVMLVLFAGLVIVAGLSYLVLSHISKSIGILIGLTFLVLTTFLFLLVAHYYFKKLKNAVVKG
ncbi:hypothetical protein STRDD10_00316 [Streptococcus sp. DD10]|uniref:hypothetical protein n=1 Tax=Streptococcus sp. DD10 TaxID=1777878 RepID=UPI00079BFAF2|nr:hypothetical protein [Streptococcus sp. DD10]KXT76253.1 hypothetical protein STRDD10_00316 [Streptococcus sp. DD10]